MKTSNVCIIGLGLFILGFILGLTFHKKYYPCVELPIVTIDRDTVTTRDTLKADIKPPIKGEVVRRDTVKVKPRTAISGSDTLRLKLTPVSNDSVSIDTVAPPEGNKERSGVELTPAGDIVIDIERKTYKTEDYTAVVQGWRPELVSLELYPKTTTITETITKVKRPQWAVTVGPACGYTYDQKFNGGIVLTVGYVLWSK